MAGSKDLVSGNLVMEFIGGRKWSCGVRTPSILPANVHQVIGLQHEIHTVIIIEKEAVFNNLIHQLPLSAQKPMLIVTGKGFPSHSLINLLSRFPKSARFLILVDWDPYGLEIAWCYKQRLGREIEHVAACGKQIFAHGWLHKKTLKITVQDRKKIKSLFRRLACDNPFRREATYMLHFDAKLELDVFDQEELSTLILQIEEIKNKKMR